LWEKTSDRSGVFADEEYIARVELLDRTFPGQLAAACAAFLKIARRNIAERDVTSGAILRALVGLLTHFEGYRTYIGSCDDNALRLRNAARSARATAAWGEADLPETLCAWILDSQSRDDEIRDAARRFEQLSAPLAAKAVEDTAFYRFGRLLSRNDVGFDPGRFSQSPDEFCRRFAKRAHDFPHAMLATATHDHKRGEDVRARLAVVSEMPAAWRRFVARFTAEDLGGEIDPADRYQILQTIVGAWPLGTIDCTFKARVEQWCVKSLREAKLRSSWVQPSEQYEQSCSAFISSIIDDAQCRRMIIDFVDTIAPAGALNGLAQTLLRVSLPGIPDCYQGAELWDFSLVDPDNRRPIDYGLRQNIGSWDDYGNLVRDWRDGRVKQALIAHALALRREHQTVFSAPLTSLAVTGQQSDHIFAFRRSTPSVELLVVVPLHSAAGLDCGDKISLSRGWLGDTIIHNGSEPISAAAILDVAPIAIRLRST
jgi:(1->4)-alpha-D-glucan 1-alpha-D-glucosylmutase